MDLDSVRRLEDRFPWECSRETTLSIVFIEGLHLFAGRKPATAPAVGITYGELGILFFVLPSVG